MSRARASGVALAGAALALAAGCAPVAPAAAPAPSATPAGLAERRLPNDVRWVRGSAEYRALAVQAFRLAEERLPSLAAGRAAGTWAVILDADETVLDNSEYQRRRALVDSGYTSASWAVWVQERAAPAVPGAAAFTQRVRALGGRVAIVTNRAEPLCDVTRANLGDVGIPVDVVLCQAPGEGDKNARFQRVADGTAAAGVPPLAVVAWVGDNIQDFPVLTQAARADTSIYADFGRRFFILPNPMYGSWEGNPEG